MATSAAMLRICARRLQTIASAYATTPRDLLTDSRCPDNIALAIGCKPDEIGHVVTLCEQSDNRKAPQ